MPTPALQYFLKYMTCSYTSSIAMTFHISNTFANTMVYSCRVTKTWPLLPRVSRVLDACYCPYASMG